MMLSLLVTLFGAGYLNLLSGGSFARSPSASPQWHRGVHPELFAKFEKHIHPNEHTFKCGGNDKVINLESLNDNFCDCPDGSDEPATGACRNGPTFWCKNEHSRGKNISPPFVNDGVCDCCDGSDEWQSPLLCKNTCVVDGKARQKAESREFASIQAGMKERKRLEARGRAAVDGWRRQKTLLESRVGSMEGKVHALKAKKAEVALTNTPVQGKGDEEAPHTRMDTLVTGEANGAGGTEKHVSEYTKWMDTDNISPADFDKGQEFDDADEMEKPSWPVEWGSKLVSKSKEKISRVYDAYFRPASQLERVQNELKKLEGDLRDLKREATNLGKKLSHFYGKENEFAPLLDTCTSKEIDKYSYKICLYGDATQIEGSKTTKLGHFSSLVVDNIGPPSMKFERGLTCGGGVYRSMTVEFICGSHFDLLEVSEPSKCIYTAKATCPAACQGESNQATRQEFDEL